MRAASAFILVASSPLCTPFLIDFFAFKSRSHRPIRPPARSAPRELARNLKVGVKVAWFSPDAKFIYAVAADRTLRRWPIDPLAAAIKRKPRDLTPKERARYLGDLEAMAN